MQMHMYLVGTSGRAHTSIVRQQVIELLVVIFKSLASQKQQIVV